MDERGLCVWNGEWGPVYARKEYEGERTDAINEERYRVLKDQLEIYNKASCSLHVIPIQLDPQRLGTPCGRNCLVTDFVSSYRACHFSADLLQAICC